jgi:GPH family glycoside/pentoside/hexuronide:cation symporter
MSAVPPAERLPFRVKVGHGIGSAAYGVKDNGFSTLLLLFYNQVMGLDPGLVGVVLLVALLLDAIVDPFVGHISWTRPTRVGASAIPGCMPQSSRWRFAGPYFGFRRLP